MQRCISSDVQKNVHNQADSCKNIKKANGCKNAENAEEIIAACRIVLKHPFLNGENLHYLFGNPNSLAKCSTLFLFCCLVVYNFVVSLCIIAKNAEEIIAACSIVLKHPFPTHENQYFMLKTKNPSFSKKLSFVVSTLLLF